MELSFGTQKQLFSKNENFQFYGYKNGGLYDGATLFCNNIAGKGGDVDT